VNPPCFAKQNATALAGAEDFTPCFASPITFCISLLYENIICRSPLFFLSYYPQKWYNPIMNKIQKTALFLRVFALTMPFFVHFMPILRVIFIILVSK